MNTAFSANYDPELLIEHERLVIEALTNPVDPTYVDFINAQIAKFGLVSDVGYTTLDRSIPPSPDLCDKTGKPFRIDTQLDSILITMLRQRERDTIENGYGGFYNSLTGLSVTLEREPEDEPIEQWRKATTDIHEALHSVFLAGTKILTCEENGIPAVQAIFPLSGPTQKIPIVEAMTSGPMQYTLGSMLEEGWATALSCLLAADLYPQRNFEAFSSFAIWPDEPWYDPIFFRADKVSVEFAGWRQAGQAFLELARVNPRLIDQTISVANGEMTSESYHEAQAKIFGQTTWDAVRFNTNPQNWVGVLEHLQFLDSPKSYTS